MRKTLLGALVPVAAIAGMLGAGTAQAAGDYPTLPELHDYAVQDGAALGGGATGTVANVLMANTLGLGYFLDNTLDVLDEHLPSCVDICE